MIVSYKFIKTISINISILIIVFILVESISTYLFKDEFVNFKKKILLYSENKVFENYDNIFLHKKNSKFISSTFYFDEDKKEIVNEYRYTVTTNNEGLVQKKNINKNTDTIFILGASETKGQGAEPWFYNFETNFNNISYQFANIGFIGTGPEQQIKIMNLIKKKNNLNVKKIIFIITSGEMYRSIWNFNNQQIKCLTNHLKCIGTENIYGYDFKLNKEKDFAQNIFDIKKNDRNGILPVYNSLKNLDFTQALKEIAKNSYFIKKIYLSLFKSKSMINDGKSNELAIKSLNDMYLNKIYILHLSSKNQTDSLDSKGILKVVNKLKMENKYYYCQLEPEKDFHKNDSHPNKLGYKKLFDCLLKILKK